MNIVIIFILIFIIALISFGLRITFIFLNSFVMTKKQAEKIKKKNRRKSFKSRISFNRKRNRL